MIFTLPPPCFKYSVLGVMSSAGLLANTALCAKAKMFDFGLIRLENRFSQVCEQHSNMPFGKLQTGFNMDFYLFFYNNTFFLSTSCLGNGYPVNSFLNLRCGSLQLLHSYAWPLVASLSNVFLIHSLTFHGQSLLSRAAILPYSFPF